MRNIQVAVWGFGAMGSGITRVLLQKTGVEIASVCDLHPERVGKSIFSLLDIPRGDRPDVIITDDINVALPMKGADVCIVATDSFTKGVYPKLVKVLSHGVNAISTAEEMSYPAAKEPELTKEIDRVAKEFGVTA
ncbi:MAG: NADP-binding protein, partial [Clostridiales bacterium]|nr:NADP-binding protein [Clostridiales bacterium]